MKVRSTPGPLQESNILTIAWTGIINSNPPMTYISVQPKRYSYDIIEVLKDGEWRAIAAVKRQGKQ